MHFLHPERERERHIYILLLVNPMIDRLTVGNVLSFRTCKTPTRLNTKPTVSKSEAIQVARTPSPRSIQQRLPYVGWKKKRPPCPATEPYSLSAIFARPSCYFWRSFSLRIGGMDRADHCIRAINPYRFGSCARANEMWPYVFAYRVLM